ncbi:response regulator transcription factor [Risungbinella massiliensis]|uniref:response regulator transcription factor n=1 Tax=Risungbinella massiliensis TaxID=1329796 RepID=UPI000B1C0970|nr:response regulator transcription factor [Risungbinella massiliensis]
MMWKLLIADDQTLMREGLKTLLELETNFTVVATASNGEEAYRKTKEYQPDVILMDIRMPTVDGVEGTKRITRDFPDTKVLVLTTFNDQEYILAALESGARGYLLKDLPIEAMAKAIETVAHGGVVMLPQVTGQILPHLMKQSHEQAIEDQRITQLTGREKEILSYIGSGFNNREISESLFLSEGTVKNYVTQIMSKLELRDRTQTAIFAVRHGYYHGDSFPKGSV